MNHLSPETAAPLSYRDLYREFNLIVYPSGPQLHCFASLSQHSHFQMQHTAVFGEKALHSTRQQANTVTDSLVEKSSSQD